MYEDNPLSLIAQLTVLVEKQAEQIDVLIEFVEGVGKQECLNPHAGHDCWDDCITCLAERAFPYEISS